ncbi:MAG: glycosyltransferase family 4 protein [Candidatus Nanoarchaeia archaeon]|nr:glycosyltransferase family 4 protein [Candidatus Nanoarchaeia archaeon]
MKVLMLGWEFPPFFAGGAGIVCSALSEALIQRNVDVTFVMPSGPEDVYAGLDSKLSTQKTRFKILIANNKYKNIKLNVRKISSLLHAYATQESYNQAYSKLSSMSAGKFAGGPIYGKNLKQEVYRFAEQVKLLALEEEFDVIHAHDWVTFPAAVALKKMTGKPMVIHVHITEFDKSGGIHADSEIYQIEKEGMDNADRVITVSNKIKDTIINKYFIDPSKIRVVHNAATPMDESIIYDAPAIKSTDKIVLFAGRVTLQKGPDYFIAAAKKVLEKAPNTTFVIAGTGDMLNKMIERVAFMGMADKFVFTGFFNEEQREKLFSMADVFVMPSVSEPFGIVPYEAQLKRTPTIISRQSGIAEVLNHTLKVDFWDVDQIANKILALLTYAPLHKAMTNNGYHEAKAAVWDIPATKCLNIYRELVWSEGN